MKKGIAVFTALLAVSCFVGAATMKGEPGGSSVVFAFLGVAFAALTVFFCTRKKKVVPVVAPAPTGKYPFGRSKEIVLESLQLMNETKHVDTFVHRYEVARKNAERMGDHLSPEEAADIVATVDEAFSDCLLDAVDRDLAATDLLMTPADKRSRAKKALNALVDATPVDDAGQAAVTEAIRRVKGFLAVQS